jgi:hypothetical protein
MCIEEEVSPADWSLAGLAPEYMPRAADTAIEKAWDLLRPDGGQLWRPLCEAARTLMQHGFVEMKPGMVAAALAQEAQLERRLAEALERARQERVLSRQ